DFPIPAYKIDAVFPIVAVVGVLWPRLIVACSVLAALSDEEFADVLGHERAHLRKQDNARRALMASTTDMLLWFSLSKQINSAWHEATEQAADDTINAANSRQRLAEALLRVARLAPSELLAAGQPASALFSGEGLDARIRRLMEDVPPLPAPKP